MIQRYTVYGLTKDVLTPHSERDDVEDGENGGIQDPSCTDDEDLVLASVPYHTSSTPLLTL